MCDDNDKLIYWLFFCTNSLRGLEEMKKAMWRVDSTGGFRFSDKNNPAQLCFFKDYDDEELAEEIVSNLQKTTPTIFQIKEFVLTETPAYKYKGALKLLEKRGLLKIIKAPDKRRAGTFPDQHLKDIHVKFIPTFI